MKNLLTTISQEEKKRILEMHSGMKKTIKEQYDDLNDEIDRQSPKDKLHDLKRKHGIKISDDFDDDDSYSDYLFDLPQNDGYKNFNDDLIKNYHETYGKDKDRSMDITNFMSQVNKTISDPFNRLRRKHGIKSLKDFGGDEESFINHVNDNHESGAWNRFNDDLKKYRK
jgi:hypothetical protein